MLKNLTVLTVVLLCCALPVLAQEPEPINVQNELAYRAGLGRADDIKLMLSQGGNPNAANKENTPLLLVAAGRKDDEAANAVQALLEGGADVNIKDAKGQTALYYAARNGNKSVVDLLLKRKIDYYSLDTNGDIARTIAFRAGHADTVQLMDDYVKEQTRLAQANYQTVDGVNKIAAEAQAKIEEEARKERERLEEEARVERERLEKEYQENVKLLPDKLRDLSYAACAFQYWSFVEATKQTIALTDEQLDNTISIHKNEVSEGALEIMKMFSTGHEYVNAIINPSKQRIYDDLNAMPSRTYRKQEGIGAPPDVEKRCKKVAKDWEIAPPKQ